MGLGATRRGWGAVLGFWDPCLWSSSSCRPIWGAVGWAPPFFGAISPGFVSSPPRFLLFGGAVAGGWLPGNCQSRGGFCWLLGSRFPFPPPIWGREGDLGSSCPPHRDHEAFPTSPMRRGCGDASKPAGGSPVITEGF